MAEGASPKLQKQRRAAPPARLHREGTVARIPSLVNGDRLTQIEFERRYHAAPEVKKAQLVEGIVFMPSPVRFPHHSAPHLKLGMWIGAYSVDTAGTAAGSDPTIRLDSDNEFQPDLAMCILPEAGGRSRFSDDGYVEGGPEIVAEVAASSAAIDMHAKRQVYRRNQVQEYLVWLTEESRIVWWSLTEGEYVELKPDNTGVIKSVVFPGLRLNVKAMLAGNFGAVISTLREGMATEDYRTFAASLNAAMEEK
jgi:Uma2 family endonuclease